MMHTSLLRLGSLLSFTYGSTMRSLPGVLSEEGAVVLAPFDGIVRESSPLSLSSDDYQCASSDFDADLEKYQTICEERVRHWRDNYEPDDIESWHLISGCLVDLGTSSYSTLPAKPGEYIDLNMNTYVLEPYACPSAPHAYWTRWLDAGGFNTSSSPYVIWDPNLWCWGSVVCGQDFYPDPLIHEKYPVPEAWQGEIGINQYHRRPFEHLCLEVPVGSYSPACSNDTLPCTRPVEGSASFLSFFSSRGGGHAEGCETTGLLWAGWPSSVGISLVSGIERYLTIQAWIKIEGDLGTQVTVVGGVLGGHFLGVMEGALVFYWEGKTPKRIVSSPVPLRSSSEFQQIAAVYNDGSVSFLWRDPSSSEVDTLAGEVDSSHFVPSELASVREEFSQLEAAVMVGPLMFDIWNRTSGNGEETARPLGDWQGGGVELTPRIQIMGLRWFSRAFSASDFAFYSSPSAVKSSAILDDPTHGFENDPSCTSCPASPGICFPPCSDGFLTRVGDSCECPCPPGEYLGFGQVSEVTVEITTSPQASQGSLVSEEKLKIHGTPSGSGGWADIASISIVPPLDVNGLFLSPPDLQKYLVVKLLLDSGEQVIFPTQTYNFQGRTVFTRTSIETLSPLEGGFHGEGPVSSIPRTCIPCPSSLTPRPADRIADEGGASSLQDRCSCAKGTPNWFGLCSSSFERVPSALSILPQASSLLISGGEVSLDLSLHSVPLDHDPWLSSLEFSPDNSEFVSISASEISQFVDSTASSSLTVSFRLFHPLYITPAVKEAEFEGRVVPPAPLCSPSPSESYSQVVEVSLSPPLDLENARGLTMLYSTSSDPDWDNAASSSSPAVLTYREDVSIQARLRIPGALLGEISTCSYIVRHLSTVKPLLRVSENLEKMQLTSATGGEEYLVDRALQEVSFTLEADQSNADLSEARYRKKGNTDWVYATPLGTSAGFAPSAMPLDFSTLIIEFEVKERNSIWGDNIFQTIFRKLEKEAPSLNPFFLEMEEVSTLLSNDRKSTSDLFSYLLGNSEQDNQGNYRLLVSSSYVLESESVLFTVMEGTTQEHVQNVNLKFLTPNGLAFDPAYIIKLENEYSDPVQDCTFSKNVICTFYSQGGAQGASSGVAFSSLLLSQGTTVGFWNIVSGGYPSQPLSIQVPSFSPPSSTQVSSSLIALSFPLHNPVKVISSSSSFDFLISYRQILSLPSMTVEVSSPSSSPWEEGSKLWVCEAGEWQSCEEWTKLEEASSTEGRAFRFTTPLTYQEGTDTKNTFWISVQLPSLLASLPAELSILVADEPSETPDLALSVGFLPVQSASSSSYFTGAIFKTTPLFTSSSSFYFSLTKSGDAPPLFHGWLYGLSPSSAEEGIMEEVERREEAFTLLRDPSNTNDEGVHSRLFVGGEGATGLTQTSCAWPKVCALDFSGSQGAELPGIFPFNLASFKNMCVWRVEAGLVESDAYCLPIPLIGTTSLQVEEEGSVISRDGSEGSKLQDGGWSSVEAVNGLCVSASGLFDVQMKVSEAELSLLDPMGELEWTELMDWETLRTERGICEEGEMQVQIDLPTERRLQTSTSFLNDQNLNGVPSQTFPRRMTSESTKAFQLQLRTFSVASSSGLLSSSSPKVFNLLSSDRATLSPVSLRASASSSAFEFILSESSSPTPGIENLEIVFSWGFLDFASEADKEEAKAEVEGFWVQKATGDSLASLTAKKEGARFFVLQSESAEETVNAQVCRAPLLCLVASNVKSVVFPLSSSVTAQDSTPSKIVVWTSGWLPPLRPSPLLEVNILSQEAVTQDVGEFVGGSGGAIGLLVLGALVVGGGGVVLLRRKCKKKEGLLDEDWGGLEDLEEALRREEIEKIGKLSDFEVIALWEEILDAGSAVGAEKIRKAFMETVEEEGEGNQGFEESRMEREALEDTSRFPESLVLKEEN